MFCAKAAEAIMKTVVTKERNFMMSDDLDCQIEAGRGSLTEAAVKRKRNCGDVFMSRDCARNALPASNPEILQIAWTVYIGRQPSTIMNVHDMKQPADSDIRSM